MEKVFRPFEEVKLMIEIARLEAYKTFCENQKKSYKEDSTIKQNPVSWTKRVDLMGHKGKAHRREEIRRQLGL